MGNDLISRQEAIAWVNNILDVIRYYHPHSKSRNVPIDNVIDALERVPAEDAVPVIHCKDCKYFFAAGEIDDFPACTAWDDGSVAVMSHTDPEGYCHQAKRKTE